MPLARALPIALLLLVVVAGCTSSAADDPKPPVKTDRSTKQAVPAVTDPLDLAAFRPQPCAVLTPAQLTTLGMPNPGQPSIDTTEAKLRDYCTWLLTAGEDQVVVSMPKPHLSDVDLAAAYESRDIYAYFEETTVSGYPAVFAGVTDNRPAGGCDLSVGVTDGEVVNVAILVTGADPCALATTVATEVIATLKAQ